jgi:hypothetical protein
MLPQPNEEQLAFRAVRTAGSDRHDRALAHDPLDGRLFSHHHAAGVGDARFEQNPDQQCANAHAGLRFDMTLLP